MKKNIITSVLSLTLLVQFGISQEVHSSAGEFGSNATLQYTYTIGEPIIETGTLPNNYVTQGFNQPFDNCIIKPVIEAGNDQTICEGDTVSFTGSGGVSYTWDNGVTEGVPFIVSSTATFTVTGTDDNGCTNTDSVVITTLQLPSISSGGDQTICDGDTVTLSGSGGISYTWDNGLSDGVPFTLPATTTYTVTGTDANGCTNTDYATITVNLNPSVDAGNDQTICEGSPITLSGTGASSYVWNNGVSDGTQFNPTVTTTYAVIGTDASGCSATDSVTITVSTSLNVIAGADTTICEGESITLTAAGAVNYAWDNGVTDGISFTPLNTTTYIVVGTDNNNCEGTDTVSVFLNPSPNLSGTTTDISQGADGAIDIDVIGGTPPFVYDWDMDGLGDFDDDEDLYNLDAGTYMLVVMGNEGCKDTLILIISEDTDVTANPLLSPNGDGINDVWLIDGLSNYPQCKVNVLNRWGQVLFSSVGYSTPWDGTYNGTLLPVSDYFYIIDFGDGTVNKGTITIKY